MADEDLSLNEDQLLENLDEANGENETELINENEVRPRNALNYSFESSLRYFKKQKKIQKIEKYVYIYIK